MIYHLLYSFHWKVVKMDKRRNPSSKRTIFKFGDCIFQIIDLAIVNFHYFSIGIVLYNWKSADNDHWTKIESCRKINIDIFIS